MPPKLRANLFAFNNDTLDNFDDDNSFQIQRVDQFESNNEQNEHNFEHNFEHNLNQQNFPIVRPLILDDIQLESNSENSYKDSLLLHQLNTSIVDDSDLHSSIGKIMEIENNYDNIKKIVIKLKNSTFSQFQRIQRNIDSQNGSNSSLNVMSLFFKFNISFSFIIPFYSILDLKILIQKNIRKNQKNTQNIEKYEKYEKIIQEYNIYQKNHLFQYKMTLGDLFELLPPICSQSTSILSYFGPTKQNNDKNNEKNNDNKTNNQNFLTFFELFSDHETNAFISAQWRRTNSIKKLILSSQIKQLTKDDNDNDNDNDHDNKDQNNNSTQNTSHSFTPPLTHHLPPSIVLSVLCLTLQSLLLGCTPKDLIPFPKSQFFQNNNNPNKNKIVDQNGKFQLYKYPYPSTPNDIINIFDSALNKQFDPEHTLAGVLSSQDEFKNKNSHNQKNTQNNPNNSQINPPPHSTVLNSSEFTPTNIILPQLLNFTLTHPNSDKNTRDMAIPSNISALCKTLVQDLFSLLQVSVQEECQREIIRVHYDNLDRQGQNGDDGGDDGDDDDESAESVGEINRDSGGSGVQMQSEKNPNNSQNDLETISNDPNFNQKNEQNETFTPFNDLPPTITPSPIDKAQLRLESIKDRKINKTLQMAKEATGYLNSIDSNKKTKIESKNQPHESNNVSDEKPSRNQKSRYYDSDEGDDDDDYSDDNNLSDPNSNLESGLLQLAETAPRSLLDAYNSITKAHFKKIGSDIDSCTFLDQEICQKRFKNVPSSEQLIIRTLLAHRYTTPLATSDSLQEDYFNRVKNHDKWEQCRQIIETTIYDNSKPSRVFIPIIHNISTLRKLSKQDRILDLKTRKPRPGDVLLTTNSQSNQSLGNGLIYCPSLVWDLLLPHQQKGVQWLTVKSTQHTGCILADEMGLGKSVQIGAFLAAQYYSWYLGTTTNSFQSILVVPASLITLWLHELHIWCPSLRVYSWFPTESPHQIHSNSGVSTGSGGGSSDSYEHNDDHYGLGANNLRQYRLKVIDSILNNKDNQCSVLVVSYHTLASPLLHSFLDRIKFTHLIMDECQHIANPRTKSHQNSLRIKANWRVLLTGTPIQNSLEDLWSLLIVAHIPLPGPYSLIQDVLRKQRSEEEVRTAIKVCHLVRKSISPYLLRRLKENTVKLPPQKHSIVMCTMKSQQVVKYNEYIDLMNSFTKTGLQRSPSRNKIFSGIGYLLRITTHPDLVETQLSKRENKDLIKQEQQRQKDLVERERLQSYTSSILAQRDAQRLENKNLYGITREEDRSVSVKGDVGGNDAKKSIAKTARAVKDVKKKKRVYSSSSSSSSSSSDSSTDSSSSDSDSDDDLKGKRKNNLSSKNSRKKGGPSKSPSGTKSRSKMDDSCDSGGEFDPLDDDDGDEFDAFDNDDDIDLFDDSLGGKKRLKKKQRGDLNNSNPIPDPSFGLINESILTGEGRCLNMIKKSKCGLIGGYFDENNKVNQYIPGSIKPIIPPTSTQWTSITDKYPCIREIPEHWYGSYHNSEKIQCVLQLLCSWLCDGQKVTIFSSSVKALNILCQHIRPTWLRIDGSTPLLQRSHIASLFNTGVCPLLFASTKCVSEGITLSNTDKVILISSSFNPAADAQCLARTHRLGRTKECHVFTMMVKNSIESYVLHTQHRKSVMADAVLRGTADTKKAIGRGLSHYLKPYRLLQQNKNLNNNHIRDKNSASFDDEDGEINKFYHNTRRFREDNHDDNVDYFPNDANVNRDNQPREIRIAQGNKIVKLRHSQPNNVGIFPKDGSKPELDPNGIGSGDVVDGNDLNNDEASHNYSSTSNNGPNAPKIKFPRHNTSHYDEFGIEEDVSIGKKPTFDINMAIVDGSNTILSKLTQQVADNTNNPHRNNNHGINKDTDTLELDESHYIKKFLKNKQIEQKLEKLNSIKHTNDDNNNNEDDNDDDIGPPVDDMEFLNSLVNKNTFGQINNNNNGNNQNFESLDIFSSIMGSMSQDFNQNLLSNSNPNNIIADFNRQFNINGPYNKYESDTSRASKANFTVLTEKMLSYQHKQFEKYAQNDQHFPSKSDNQISPISHHNSHPSLIPHPHSSLHSSIDGQYDLPVISNRGILTSAQRRAMKRGGITSTVPSHQIIPSSQVKLPVKSPTNAIDMNKSLPKAPVNGTQGSVSKGLKSQDVKEKAKEISSIEKKSGIKDKSTSKRSNDGVKEEKNNNEKKGGERGKVAQQVGFEDSEDSKDSKDVNDKLDVVKKSNSNEKVSKTNSSDPTKSIISIFKQISEKVNLEQTTNSNHVTDLIDDIRILVDVTSQPLQTEIDETRNGARIDNETKVCFALNHREDNKKHSDDNHNQEMKSQNDEPNSNGDEDFDSLFSF